MPTQLEELYKFQKDFYAFEKKHSSQTLSNTKLRSYRPQYIKYMNRFVDLLTDRQYATSLKLHGDFPYDRETYQELTLKTNYLDVLQIYSFIADTLDRFEKRFKKLEEKKKANRNSKKAAMPRKTRSDKGASRKPRRKSSKR